jgi:hypothetical protein
MQTQSSKATFWNNLILWLKAFDSTAQHHKYKYERNQRMKPLMKRSSECPEVSGQPGIDESGVTVR